MIIIEIETMGVKKSDCVQRFAVFYLSQISEELFTIFPSFDCLRTFSVKLCLIFTLFINANYLHLS